ncbi:hypothetical protein [Nocardia sp. NBC_01388]|uniref:hypothetical protein n=1 Tax=Nocardia sp. NBC_01388 TaxID=2903596 RepID=UPI00324C322E
MVRLVHSVLPALATVGALAAIAVVPAVLNAVVPTRETDVAAGTHITLTATGFGSLDANADPNNAVTFAVPQAMRRIATGDESRALFRSEDGETRLGLSAVYGITDFDTAGPRMLLPIRASDPKAHFDGGTVDAGSFHGLLCVLPKVTGGVCAVADSGGVGVTITVSGSTPEAGRALIQAVLESSRAVQA